MVEKKIKVERNCAHWQWTAGIGVGGSRLFDTEEEAREDAERYFRVRDQIDKPEFITDLVRALEEAGYDREVIAHIIAKGFQTRLTWA
jgi:hypothetical protein